MLEGFECGVGFAAEGGFVDHGFSLAVRISKCGVERGEDVGWLGANAEVGVGFGEGDGVSAVDDEDGRERETPTGFGGVVIAEAGVVEGDVDEDGLEVAAVIRRDGVGDAEFFCDGGTGVGEQREAEAVLLESEVVLACGLGGDGDE